LETIMLTNLMFEVIGSTTYRIALGRIKHPAVRKLLTILARDESFHVPLNVHFIRAMLRHRAPSRWRMARLRGTYHAVFWLLIASAAASRPVAQKFDHISFRELARAYAENLARLFLREEDLRFSPPSLALALFRLRACTLLDGEDLLSAAAAEASADRENVLVTALAR
ncbi:MAG TPA: ferritin-like domain-containing protein, partial [Polyangia bacterium]